MFGDLCGRLSFATQMPKPSVRTPGLASGKYHKQKNHLTVLFIFMVISAGVEPALTG